MGQHGASTRYPARDVPLVRAMKMLRAPDGLVHVDATTHVDRLTITACEWDVAKWDADALQPTKEAPTCLECLWRWRKLGW